MAVQNLAKTFLEGLSYEILDENCTHRKIKMIHQKEVRLDVIRFI